MAADLNRLELIADAMEGAFPARARDIRKAIAEIRELRASLRQLVEDWDSVPEDVQVPDEINEDAHWARARAILGMDVPNIFDEEDS